MKTPPALIRIKFLSNESKPKLELRFFWSGVNLLSTVDTKCYKINKQNRSIMKFYKTLFIAFLAWATFSCKTEDDDQEEQVIITSPSNLTFSESTIDINFYTEGSTTPVTLEWGGETGNFELGSPVQGVTVNSALGTITWDKSLPLGGTNITVIARNSGGSTSAMIQIQNNFQGSFQGGYNSDATSADYNTGYNMTFNPDGTMYGDDQGFMFSGSYTLTGNVLDVSYTYDGGGSYSTSGTITYDNITNPFYQGTWGATPSDDDGGGLRLEMN